MIPWLSTFDPKIPGTGWLMRRGLNGFVAGLTRGLEEYSSRTGDEPRDSATHTRPSSDG